MLNKSARAAQYVRMSTEMQQYSIANQCDEISAYAARRGLTIVKTYEDGARSGLRLKGRPALRELLADVEGGRADFNVILVYDVSRWGRFQDTDESAYYEFLCRKAGIEIEYCAEPFANDGSLSAAVLKSIKRAMAGEYSRELSVKVHAGQSRIAAMGFRRGGGSGFGLRRCLVDANGRRKGVLEAGEWKSINTDRIILVPGPPHEIEAINRVYRMFVEDRLSLVDIASRLNAEGSRNALGRAWAPTAVRDLLSNEKYIGNNVFNQTSKTLGGKWRKNPRARWVKAAGAFQPIVSPQLFRRAQQRFDEFEEYSPNQLLDSLTAIWCRFGTVSVETLYKCPEAPQPHAYQRCFGGLGEAYNRIGFVRPRVAQWVKNKKFRAEINEQVIKGVRASGGDARIMPGGYALQVNEELVVASSIVRLARTKNGDKRWIFGYKTRRRPDILIVARMSEQANAVRDYFCLPYLTIGGNWFTFSDGKDSRVDPFQMTSLAPLCQILGRETISQKADASSPPQGSDPDDTLVCANELGVEESIAHLLRRLQVVFADPRLAKLMRSHEIGTLPRVLTRPEQDGRSSDHGRCVLHFTVLRSFMLRLAKQPEIAARLAQLWPTVFAELKLVYLAILTEAPRESLPYANRFGRAASMRTG